MQLRRLLLLVLDADGSFDRYVSSTLLAIGHDVTTCTTLAGLVESLMRDGGRYDAVVLNAVPEALFSDAARYAHWYAPEAMLVALDHDRLHAGALALPFPIHVSTVLDLPATTSGKLLQ